MTSVSVIKRKSMKLKMRLIVGALFCAIVLTWFVAPSAFVHGVLIGMVLMVGLVIGGAMLFSKIMAAKNPNRELAPPPLPTASWDYQMALTDLDGNPVMFADGPRRVLVLNFWATWCPPCVAEMPSLQRLRDATTHLDVRFALITSEETAVVRKFLEKKQWDLPVYILSGDRPECFKGRAIPATFVVDKTGTVVLRHFGAAAWDAPDVVTFIGGLAARPVS